MLAAVSGDEQENIREIGKEFGNPLKFDAHIRGFGDPYF